MSKRMRSELFRRSEQIHRMEPSEYPSDGSSSEVEVRTAKIWSRVKSRYGVSSSLPEMLQSQLKLRFINSPPPIIFTSSRIEANDGSLIAIELVDAATNTRVTLDSRLEIVALNADINEESWTTEEFNRNILRPREGKRPLLVGDLTVTLKEGVGVIDGDVAFTDNSCWLRSRKFRLGAKVTEGGVVEAISKAFVCKDHPGGSYRKHYPPYPDSEVWRLYKLTKNGVTESHLRKAGIHTVKDLRRHLAIHPNALPRELEGKISEKRWNAIVSHSMQCVLDKSECYLYKSEAHGASLLFNSVYEVMKVSFDGITVLNTTDLTSIQQALLDKLKREAYENRNSFLPVNDSDSVNFPLRTSKNLQDTELSIGYPGSPSIFEVERPEINADSVSFQALLDKLKREAYENRNSFLAVNDSDSVSFKLRTSKHLQDTELSIGYPGSPSIFEVERPEINSDSVSFPPRTSKNLQDAELSIGYPGSPSIFEDERPEINSDSVSFPLRTSKNLQDAELSIGYPESPNIFEDERPEIIKLVTFSDTSDVFGTLSTHVASSTSKDYDVVIRYGRGDTSNNDFISHLRAALCRRGIYVHEDFDEVDAVPECRVLIIFLTSTYVPSNLLNILEHQRKKPRVVYPFFYGITPSDLISNCKNYERFFLQDEPKRWQAALKDIAQMRGYILTDKSESELIDEIVRDALKVLCSNDNEKMIGMDVQIEKILSLLCIECPDVRSIGIWGTVGIGKTAIAEEIIRRISVQYETCVFLKDLQKEVEVKGHDAVREHFLSKILEVEPHVIRVSDIKTSFLRSRLQRKRVLVILDNVNDFRDVETFLGKLNYFGPGSRIIITSRNRHVFLRCKIDQVYEVKPLDISKSLLLLECGTSQTGLSSGPNRTLSLELVKFSNGNPEVLQLLSKSVREWKRLSQQIQKTSPIYIPGIFERICCGLDDNERSIFLDIACFYRRMDKDNVAMLLDGCGFSAHVGFRSLVDKSLLTISHNMVDMLRFIQATGREIVRQESPDRPGDRSRLWNSEDIRDVFIDDSGTLAIEGIFLDMSKLKMDGNPYVFEKMCNLRLLKFYCSVEIENGGVSLPQGLEYLPSKLRLLHWEYYPLSSLPQSFDPKNLVELNLPNSSVKKLWKGKKSLEELKKMRLSYSYQLTKTPRLSSAPNLEHIDLEGCNSLVSISQSICNLKKLVFLNLKDCSNLESIPSTVGLESLEVLNLSGCSKLENFPEISPKVKEVYMGGTMIQEIPPSIKNLVLLEKLDLENSRHLVNLPTSICKLKHLETLNLSDCSSLERFPDLSRRMKCLKSLDLSRTAIKELSSSISYLTALEELRFVDCKNLVRFPDNAWSLRFKVEFRQIDTEKFSRLWNRFGWLKKVQIS